MAKLISIMGFDMLEKIEIVKERNIYCNGDDKIDGHPKIYLEIDKDDEVTCPYCNKKFMYKENS